MYFCDSFVQQINFVDKKDKQTGMSLLKVLGRQKSYVKWITGIGHHLPLQTHSPRLFSFSFRSLSLAADVRSDLPNCNVGTIGHIDHGKTTLTAAITKVLSDAGQANVGYWTGVRRYAHTDCPGHRDFIKNMICGTSQMDGAILVVAATDGPMPQTNEHISLAKALGVDRMIVYINKADVVDNEVLELVDMEVRELLEEYGYDSEKCPFIVGSALCALNGEKEEIGKKSILELIDAMDRHISLPERDLKAPLLLPLESAFNVSGRGTVAVGTISRGTVKKSDKLHLIGFGKKFDITVSDIERFKESVSNAVAGDHVGVLMKGVKRDVVERGMCLCKPNSVPLTNYIEAQIYVRSKEEGGRSKPIKDNYQQVMFMDLFNISCLLEMPEGRDMIMPGV